MGSRFLHGDSGGGARFSGTVDEEVVDRRGDMLECFVDDWRVQEGDCVSVFEKCRHELILASGVESGQVFDERVKHDDVVGVDGVGKGFGFVLKLVAAVQDNASGRARWSFAHRPAVAAVPC